MNELVVIAGLSGAGRTEAARNMEDLGWFVIDNLPPSLMPKVADLASTPGGPRLALVVGTGHYYDELMPALAELRSGGNRVRILFLDAATEVLVRRYEGTRRRHPFSSEHSLADAIEAERVALDPVKAEADLFIDTSDLNVHQLRARVADLFDETDERPSMRTSIVSFGFKHGLPLDVDMVIDCRFLPNPHWEEELRPLTGLDPAVEQYVLGQAISATFLERLRRLLGLLLPAYVAEGKSYLTIAFGCTGGHHRAVAIAERVAADLRALGYDPTVTHRDVDR